MTKGTTDRQLVGYVGPAALHDATVARVDRSGNSAVVCVRTYEGHTILARFSGVTSVVDERAQGMILYALGELAHESSGRLFAFIDTIEGEEDRKPGVLEIVAEDVRFE